MLPFLNSLRARPQVIKPCAPRFDAMVHAILGLIIGAMAAGITAMEMVGVLLSIAPSIVRGTGNAATNFVFASQRLVVRSRFSWLNGLRTVS